MQLCPCDTGDLPAEAAVHAVCVLTATNLPAAVVVVVDDDNECDLQHISEQRCDHNLIFPPYVQCRTTAVSLAAQTPAKQRHRYSSDQQGLSGNVSKTLSCFICATSSETKTFHRNLIISLTNPSTSVRTPQRRNSLKIIP